MTPPGVAGGLRAEREKVGEAAAVVYQDFELYQDIEFQYQIFGGSEHRTR